MHDTLHYLPDFNEEPALLTDRLSGGRWSDWEPEPERRGPPPQPLESVAMWGLELACLTSEETVAQVEELIRRRTPSFFITANLHYAMLTAHDPRLAAINRQAAFLVADGMPMVWYSRLKWRSLPERVAGADLIYRLCEQAARHGHRVFLLGGGHGVADQAAENLRRRYGPLNIVGVEAPELDQLSVDEQAQLVAWIRQSDADLLLVAFGQPKGELWLAEQCEALGVPVCVQLGASLDFVAGRIPRAPRWMQRVGLEWSYRVWREPRRMVPRYWQDARFLLRMLARDLWDSFRRKRP